MICIFSMYFFEKIIPDLGSGVMRTDNTLRFFLDHVHQFPTSVIPTARKKIKISKSLDFSRKQVDDFLRVVQRKWILV